MRSSRATAPILAVASVAGRRKGGGPGHAIAKEDGTRGVVGEGENREEDRAVAVVVDAKVGGITCAAAKDDGQAAVVIGEREGRIAKAVSQRRQVVGRAVSEGLRNRAGTAEGRGHQAAARRRVAVAKDGGHGCEHQARDASVAIGRQVAVGQHRRGLDEVRREVVGRKGLLPVSPSPRSEMACGKDRCASAANCRSR